jgi:hypothetical protein
MRAASLRQMTVLPVPDNELGSDAFTTWPGGADTTEVMYHYDRDRDVAWMRLSTAPASAVTAVAIAELDCGRLVVHLDAADSVLAIGFAQASACLPVALLLPGKTPRVAVGYNRRADQVEIALVTVPPLRDAQPVLCRLGGTSRLAIALLIEQGGVIALAAIHPARRHLDPAVLPAQRPTRWAQLKAAWRSSR